ncbi:MAG: complex I subunit 5 family protein [Bacillota bacterium]
MADIFASEIADTTVKSILPLLIVVVPIIGSVSVGMVGLKSVVYRNWLAGIVAALTFYFCLELFILTLNGNIIYYPLPSLAGVEMSFKVDLFGSVFAFFSSFIWLLATLASLRYMAHENNQNRYYVFLILTLGGCVGVFLCGDFLSLFLFFELMTLASYALVVHNQNKEAMAAGFNYLYLGVIGGLALLSGIILLNTHAGNVEITPLLQELINHGEIAALIAVLMVIGFGVKAGMVPLHIWLPQAHPVAPAPASALLSGIMIKTGAYGIIRVSTMLYSPGKEAAESGAWFYTANFGHIIIWISIVTMLLAAIMAVLQNNAKRLLAYSSISQMGYILMGVGAAGYLGYDGPMGFGGFSYHIINHAFFKSGMFIFFGVIYARLHEKNLDQLGGLWRRFPFTFAAFAVCAAGIMGVPGLNGYVSKTILHHAIEYAYEANHLWDLWLAEKLFVLTSGLTVCYIAKLFISIFLGASPHKLQTKLYHSSDISETWIERIIALSYIGAIIFLGTNSTFMLKKVITPMASAFTYSDYYLEYVAKTTVWHSGDLIGVGIGLGLGTMFYLIFKKKEIFSYQPPSFLSIERLFYRPVVYLLGAYYTRGGKVIDDTLNVGYHRMPAILAKASSGAAYLDDPLLTSFGFCITGSAIKAFENIYSLWMGLVRMTFGGLGQFLHRVFMLLFKFDYSSRGDKRFQIFNISNIDFDLYIVLIVIGAILATSLLFLL